MKNKKIGKYILSFIAEGCDPKYFRGGHTYHKTFTKNGEMDDYIDEMMDRGYVFEDCWSQEDWDKNRANPIVR